MKSLIQVCSTIDIMESSSYEIRRDFGMSAIKLIIKTNPAKKSSMQLIYYIFISVWSFSK